MIQQWFVVLEFEKKEPPEKNAEVTIFMTCVTVFKYNSSSYCHRNVLSYSGEAEWTWGLSVCLVPVYNQTLSARLLGVCPLSVLLSLSSTYICQTFSAVSFRNLGVGGVVHRDGGWSETSSVFIQILCCCEQTADWDLGHRQDVVEEDVMADLMKEKQRHTRSLRFLDVTW